MSTRGDMVIYRGTGGVTDITMKPELTAVSSPIMC